ncbi:MAG: sigma 54-interacting transcriptional regulator [Acidobacteriota bacterium]
MTEASFRYRLRSSNGSNPSRFVMRGERATIGSDGDCDWVLTVRGVSRRHADLEVRGFELWVCDRDSKNGVFRNDQPVQEARLGVGDRLRLGTTEWIVERVEADDADLGLALGGAEATARRPTVTAQLTQRERARLEPWLDLLEAVVAQLSWPTGGDRVAALEEMVATLGARGAALLEAGPRGRSRILAKVGELPPGRGPLAAAEEADGRLVALLARRGRADLQLVVWGDGVEKSAERLLTTALQLFAAFEASPPMADPQPPAVGDSELVFGADYVRGQSAVMRDLYRQMATLADSDLPVLVRGETGVGKEPVARALHASSARRDGPFVALNCAALPEELLEAELFGIGAGVATGVHERRGRVEEADRGTLFLDELGELPQPLQAKLLRVLQEREVLPLGRPPMRVDVRFVAATGRDLTAAMAAGEFRSDLYYRIAGGVLEVPPLRARRGDLSRLMLHFLERACRETGKSVRGLTVRALESLESHSWPGNVRELEHEMRRLVIACPNGEAIDSALLSEAVLAAPAVAPTNSLVIAEQVRALETRLIREALRRSRGNRTRAAEMLGISRNGLANRIRRWSLDDD